MSFVPFLFSCSNPKAYSSPSPDHPPSVLTEKSVFNATPSFGSMLIKPILEIKWWCFGGLYSPDVKKLQNNDRISLQNSTEVGLRSGNESPLMYPCDTHMSERMREGSLAIVTDRETDDVEIDTGILEETDGILTLRRSRWSSNYNLCTACIIGIDNLQTDQVRLTHFKVCCINDHRWRPVSKWPTSKRNFSGSNYGNDACIVQVDFAIPFEREKKYVWLRSLISTAVMHLIWMIMMMIMIIIIIIIIVI